jgi:enoyl-CoA hydratase/carnithine racemase
MSYESIQFKIENGIALLTLNRPDRLNSFTQAMHLEVRDALDKLQADKSVRVLVLTGAGDLEVDPALLLHGDLAVVDRPRDEGQPEVVEQLLHRVAAEVAHDATSADQSRSCSVRRTSARNAAA